MKATKPAYTAKTCIAELDALAANFKRSRRGFRARLYESLIHSQRTITRLRENERLRKKFIVEIRKRAESSDAPVRARRKRASKEINLATEVVALATGAESRSARQLAWKRGRILDILREDDVEVEKIATEIKARGGIEKIIRKAASNAKNRLGGTGDHLPDRRGTKDKRLLAERKCSNDQRISLSIDMKLSDRDEILETPAGSLLGLRVRVGEGAALELVKIKRRSAAAEPEDVWE
jgi:hypothetical protein